MKILHIVIGGGEKSWPFVWYSIKLLSQNKKYQTSSKQLHNLGFLKIISTLVICKLQKIDFIVIHYGGLVAFIFSFFFRNKIIIYYRGTDRNFLLKNRFLRNYFLKKFDQFTSKNSHAIYTSAAISHNEAFQKSAILPSPINIKLLNQNMTNSLSYLFKKDRLNVFFYSGNNRQNKGSKIVDFLASKFINHINIIEAKSGTYSQSEVYSIIAECDLVLHPSLREGSPNIVKEAIYLGVPILSTYVGDLPEYESRVSCLICCSDASEFASNLQKFINKSFSFNFYSDRNFITERYGPDQFSDSFYKFLKSLL